MIETFLANVNVSGDGCWEWQRPSHPYGTIGTAYGYVYAHRFSYENFVGPVGHMFVLHRCDNPPCVRPSHLFLGTNEDNLRDMWSKGRGRNTHVEAHRAATECPNGHPYSGSNLYLRPDGRGRECKACQRDRVRKYRERNS